MVRAQRCTPGPGHLEAKEADWRGERYKFMYDGRALAKRGVRWLACRPSDAYSANWTSGAPRSEAG